MAGQQRKLGRSYTRPRGRVGMNLEQLEARDVPAIIQTGLPTFQSAGPNPSINSQVSIGGTFNNPSTGAVEEIATHPTDPNIAFIAGVNGGVWRTFNAQANDPFYQPLTDNLPSLSMGSLSLNQANPNQLLAGVARHSAAAGIGGDRVGAYYTQNALAPNPTFATLGGPLQGKEVNAVVAGGNYLVMSGDDQLYRSLDNGATITSMSGLGGLPPAAVTGIFYFAIADPSDQNRVYALAQGGLFRTNNVTAAVPTWANVTTPQMGLSLAATVNGKIAIHNSVAANVVYVSAIDVNQFTGNEELTTLTYSVDRGNTFQAMDIPTLLTGPVGITLVSDISAPITVTAPGNPFNTGDKVLVSGVTGNNGANAIFTITVTGQNTFTLDGSVGTGVYSGGGQVQKITGVNAGGQGSIHAGLTADRFNPFIVYASGDRQDSPFANGVTGFTAAVARGDRSIAPGGGTFALSPQWTSVTDDNALGTTPHADSRVLTTDALGNLVEGDDGGTYKRLAPTTDDSPWVSVNGNLALGQFYSLNYDIQNNVLFGGTQDTGSVAQATGTTRQAGDTTWVNVNRGDGGASAVDNSSTPGITYRYVTGNVLATASRQGYNSQNVQVSRSTVAFASPTDPGFQKGLDNSDLGTTIFSAKFVLNAVDPRLMMLGNNLLYEDDDPNGLAGDVVAQVTPAGLTGHVSALVYGGRQAGVNLPRIAYVGDEGGDLFVRTTVGGFNQVPLPGTDQVLSIAVDPDDFRRVYVLRGTARYDTGNVSSGRVYFSGDAGQTWVDITQNLSAPGIDANGNPIQFQTDPVTGLNVGGLSTDIRTIAVYDPTPGGSAGGGVVLLAAGRGGVFRFVPGLNDPTLFPNAGWTQFGTGLPNALVDTLSLFGNRLVVGTQGRGAFVIPDVSGTIGVAASVVVQGDAGDNTMGLFADPANPNAVILTDGMGGVFSLPRSAGGTIRFFGGGGADTIIIGANGLPGGDLSFLKSGVFVDAGGNPGDRLIVANGGRATATHVTLTSNTIGVGQGDNIFSTVPGSFITYAGLALGSLTLDLGTQAVDGNFVGVRSTSAGLTQVYGTSGSDFFDVNGRADTTNLGNLNGVYSALQFDGRNAGTDALFVSDFGATSGNQAVDLAGNQITGFAGVTDAAVIRYANVARLDIEGSNSAFLAESFFVDNPAVPTVINAYDGPDAINVRSLGGVLFANGGAGDDAIRVSSLAGQTDDGDLSLIQGALAIDAGTGSNALVVSDFGDPFGRTFNVTANAIAGATPLPIAYTATGGSFSGPAGGVLLRGSDAGNDTFNLFSTLFGSATIAAGNGGDDVFNVSDENLAGNVALLGGLGSDTFNTDPGLFGVTAGSLLFSGGGGGTDVANLTGFAGDDKTPVVNALTSTVGGRVTGLGGPLDYDTLTNLNYDGLDGNNSFAFVNASGLTFGSPTDLVGGIVYQPTGFTSGEFRVAGGTVGPRVDFVNVTGSDTGGLVVAGSGGDTVTFLGVSETGRGSSLGETTADSGVDSIGVSDQFVSISNEALGDLRSLAVVPGTVGTLVVHAGDESSRGDSVTVTPSSVLNIVVDGGSPTRKRDGDNLAVDTAEHTTVQRADAGTSALPGVRVTADSGASFTATGFENFTGARTIYAVGADAGGGPRVRVYDSVTNQVLFDQFVFETSYTGGVRVATGDVNGDGVPDLVVAAGYGGGPRVTVFDGVTFQVIANFFAYEPTFRGGVYLSVSDLTGDGVAEIIAGSGLGGGPVVRIFDGQGRTLTSFFAYDPVFRGGVRVAAGDVNGDGFNDIITGAGPGGGPHVRVFSANDLRVLTEYQAFDANYHGGVYVAAGDLDGDGSADIIAGPGDNTIPALSYRTSREGNSVTTVNLVGLGDVDPTVPLSTDDPNVAAALAANPEQGGIRVAIAALDPSGINQLLISRGPGFAPRVTAYTINPLAQTNSFLAFEEQFAGGVFVG